VETTKSCRKDPKKENGVTVEIKNGNGEPTITIKNAQGEYTCLLKTCRDGTLRIFVSGNTVIEWS
jgi:hypothetical protein